MRKLVTLLTLVLMLTLPAFAPAVSAQRNTSGGIGLTLSAMEEIFGPAEAGQSLMFFTTDEGYQLFVGTDRDSDIVTSIQFDLNPEQGGVTPLVFEDAEALVETLLPGDIDLEESFETPAISPGVPSIRAFVFESDWLEDQINDREQILVVYHEQGGQLPGSTGMDLLVSRVYISVES